MSRYSKYCAGCGKYFIITGRCANYLYRRGKLYYCGYNCWNHTEQQKPSQPKQPHHKSHRNLRHISDEPKRS